MHLVIFTDNKETLSEREYRSSFHISVDNKPMLSFCDGEPEDNTLSRNFNDVYRIPELMNQAYEAGKRGETFTTELVVMGDDF